MKAIHRMIFLGLSLLVCSGVLWAQEVAKKPQIDPQAETVLRQLSEHLKQAQSAKLRIVDTIDEVQADGRRLQFAHIRDMTIVRPDKLKVDVTGDVTNRTVWMNGKTITVFDKDKNVYAELKDPGTIEQAVDMLQEKYNMSMPGADLLAEDAYKALTSNCDAVSYVGMGYVGEEKCHHLAFTGKNIDWQLWISAGTEAAPRKMVITYKQLPGAPQYTQQVLRRERGATVDPAVFNPDVPKDAAKIAFQPPTKPE